MQQLFVAGNETAPFSSEEAPTVQTIYDGSHLVDGQLQVLPVSVSAYSPIAFVSAIPDRPIGSGHAPTAFTSGGGALGCYFKSRVALIPKMRWPRTHASRDVTPFTGKEQGPPLPPT